MTTDTIHSALLHIDLGREGVEAVIKQAKRAEKVLKRFGKVKVNKTQAAEYMGYSPDHMRRLIRQYPQRLVFTNGKIKLLDLAQFEEWYRKQKGVRYA